MNGKLVVGGLVGIALIAGAGLWYSLQHGYYERVDGLTEITLMGDPWPISDYRGIDGESSPLKLRACFTVEWEYVPTETWNDEAEPLTGPYWFTCFDAEQIAQDLEAGAASVVAADENDPFGFTTFVVQYPDGRGFMWRQINACGEADFSGEDLPEGCVETASLEQEQLVGQKKTLDGPNPGMPLDGTAMTLVPVGGGAAEDIEADDLTVRSANAEPDSLWACFRVINSIPMLTESYEIAEGAVPAAPTIDMPCFDADAIAADLASGAAFAFVGARDIAPGLDRIVAIYDDGRAFAWHQRRR